MRALGDILLEMEELLDEMVDDHDLQWGDIRSLVMQHLRTHRPDAQEEYTEGGHPIDFYGPAESLSRDTAIQLLFRILDEYRVGRPRRQWKNLMEEVEDFASQKVNV